jgi:undecaprenyl-diphosphatase
MLDLIQVIILSVLQGIAEWLPISSSGHLAIVQNIFHFENLSFDVFLHFASILAVLIIFRKDIIKLFYPWEKTKIKYLLLLLIGIIPAGLVGILFKKQIEAIFANYIYLGIFFIISGILVYSTKFSKPNREKIGYFDSIFIGIFQAIAILPGISRSGATISAGMHRGIKKEEAIKFSFIMAIPIILGAGVLELKDLAFSQINLSFLIISFIITFIISLAGIKILIKILDKEKFYLFGIYNFLLGVLVLILHLSGVI